jgi:Uma2 family endonuclease
MAAQTQVLTADDVLELPVPNGVSGYEFVDGRPVPVTHSSPIHGWLIADVCYLLKRHVVEAELDGRVLSDAGFVLGLRRDPERMRSPDVSYVGRAKLDAHENPERLFRCVPDLAVEIDLTSGRKPDGQQRIVDYLEAGTPLVWAIDPHSRTAMSYRPDGSARLVRSDGVLDAEEVVPGFRIEMRQLFPEAQ